jgi:hypothetical protein
MQFSELCAQIDARLDADAHLVNSQHSSESDESIWMLDRQTVTIRAAGSTGIEIVYGTGGRVIHSRTFAASPMSVTRIVRTISEHLLDYRASQPQET